MDNELEILKMYLTTKKEVDEVIKSFKFNLNLIDLNQLNGLKLYRFLLSIQQTTEVALWEINKVINDLINLYPAELGK